MQKREHVAADTTVASEKNTEVSFIEKKVHSDNPARCVDGRPSPESPQGAQMLGGSLHPILLHVIYTNQNLDEDSFCRGLLTLSDNGIKAGFHRDNSVKENPNLSGCGAVDRLGEILETAIVEREEIAQRLTKIYQQNEKILSDVSQASIKEAYDRIVGWYNPGRVKIFGEMLVQKAQGRGGVVETVEGDHAETVAFVNLKKDTTLDTGALNLQRKQGFNLDAWAVINQAKILGVNTQFALGVSLILYLATEIVLVEKKEKPAISVALHI